MNTNNANRSGLESGRGTLRGGYSPRDLPVPSGKGVLLGPPTTNATSTTTTTINMEMKTKKNTKKVQFSCEDIREKIKRKELERLSTVENILTNHGNKETQVGVQSALF